MFDRIKKAFSRGGAEANDAAGPPSQHAHGAMSEWAATQGFSFALQGSSQEVALEGRVGNKPWKMQLGRATRNYILGEELRARGELGVRDEVAVLVINRPLKEALEKKAYSMFTDSLQTSVDSSMPEEMRWLAMFEQVGWEGPPPEFWDRYAVMTDRRENAIAWVEPLLVQMLMDWPTPGPSSEVPFMILLLRGKAYLRMEYSPADLSTLRHATQIFTASCESALANIGAEAPR